MIPSRGEPDATDGATSPSARRRTSTIGRCGDLSSAHSSGEISEAGDGVLVGRVAGEVIAPEALDGEDRALADQVDRVLERQRELRPARGAADRLRVEAAVGRVLVLSPAVRAHREAGHRRRTPVVRDAAHDREARPALCAVHERIAVTPVARVEELMQAVVARGDVGWDQSRSIACAARDDGEVGLAERLDRVCAQ